MSAGSSTLKHVIAQVAAGHRLSEEEARAAFDVIMAGDATPAQIGGLLIGLRVRGETVEEITGAARAMRARMHPIAAPAGAIDMCGTGGDASGTYNISTAATFVVAACGVPVAKHGNRAQSSTSGAADVLSELGVAIEADFDRVERALRETGITFLMAQRHHTAMRHVAPVRTELGTRTLFNLLGPLCNPAGVKRQLVGVFAPEWVEPVAQVLKRLGAEGAWVVHGGGLDELTTAGPTLVAELKDGTVRRFEVTPADAGLPEAPLSALKGGTAAVNAEALRGVLAGHPSPYRDVVVLNAAAALVVAGKAEDLRAGAALAAAAIDSGAAASVLARFAALSRTGVAA
jgi:anthranilate phosphoribosyltransferase